MTLRWIRRLPIAMFAIVGVLPATPALADKTDVVVLVNGDHVTGEIKELDHGQLKFKTDNMGTLYIEWDKIRSVSSGQLLQVEIADGTRYLGRSPEPAARPGLLRLMPGAEGRDGSPMDIALPEVVRIAVLEEGQLKDRLDGALSVGYSFTRASRVQQFNFAGNIGSRSERRAWNVALDLQSTSQDSGPASRRAQLTGDIERFLADRYYRETSLEFTKNQELGLDLRSLAGATFGRYLVQRQGAEWKAGAGLAIAHEDRADGSRQTSLEAQLTTSLQLFRYDSPKRDVTVRLSVLPGLTETGRVRGEAGMDARYEIVSDLFFQISLYDDYDNRPPEGAQSNDWGVVTSLGYSF